MVSDIILQTGAAFLIAGLFIAVYFGSFTRKSSVKVPATWMLWYFAAGVAAMVLCLGIFVSLSALGIQLPFPLFAAAIIEESAKFVALLLVFSRKPSPGMDEFDDPMYAPAAALGAIALGLGFGLVENLFYGLGNWPLLVARQATTVPLHGLTLAIVARELGRREDATDPKSRNRRSLGMRVAFLVAIVLHSTYNLLLVQGSPWSWISAGLVGILAIYVYKRIEADS